MDLFRRNKCVEICTHAPRIDIYECAMCVCALKLLYIGFLAPKSQLHGVEDAE